MTIRPTAARLSALGLGLCLAAVPLVGVEWSARGAEGEWGVHIAWDEPERKYALKPLKDDLSETGFKDLGRLGPAAPGVWRVVVLGDSLTFGGGLSLAETYSGVAEAWLKDHGVQAELINLGVHGYDIAQVRATMRYRGWRYEPDAVVYGAFTNDGQRTRVLRMAGSERPVYVGTEPVTGFPGALLGGLLQRHSALFRWQRAERLIRRYKQEGIARQLFDDDFFVEEFSGLATDLAERDTPLLVLGMASHLLANPDIETCDPGVRPGFCLHQQNLLAQIGARVEEQGVPFVSVIPWLQATGQMSFYPPDGKDTQHPSAEGYRVIGEGLGATLLDWKQGQLSLEEQALPQRIRKGKRPPKRPRSERKGSKGGGPKR